MNNMRITVDVDNTLLNFDKNKLEGEIDKITKLVSRQFLKQSLQNIPQYHNTNPHFKSCKDIFKGTEV